MSKSYNVIINSERAVNAGSNRASLNYYIDWSSILKENGPYLMTVLFNSSAQILRGNYSYLLSMNGLSSNNYEIGINSSSANTSNIIASLNYGSIIGSQTYSYIKSSSNENAAIYLINRPSNNNFTIEIRNNINNGLFSDDAIAGAGTATLSGTTLTIATQTSGVIIIGTVITLSSVNYTVTNYGTGTGGTGTYIVDTSGTVAANTAYTSIARNQLGPYILTLKFDKL